MGRHIEHEIQCKIVGDLRKMGFIPVAVPNGAMLAGTEEQRQRRAGILKREGMLPGFPDLIVFARGGRVGLFEVKAPKGRLQKNQIAVASELAAYGTPYAVVRHTDDVLAALAEWGWVS